MLTKLRPVIFQKIWPSPSGFGGAERATARFTSAISAAEKLTVLTCGEYYRGKEKPVDYRFPGHIFSKHRLTVHEIPTVPLIVDFTLKNISEIGIFQIGWGFEHYPDDLSRILETDIPIILRICEIDQYSQLVQELPRNARRQFLNKIINRVDALVAISSPLVREAIKVGFDPKKVHLIYSSVDTNLFKPVNLATKMKIRKKMDMPTNKKIFLFVGRLVQAKGIDILLRTWRSLSSEFKNNNLLVIVGAPNKGDPAFTLIQEAISFNDPSIKFEGVVMDEPRVAKYYQMADVFVYPSIHNEGLSVSILEAMSSGLPVITTKWVATKTGVSDLIKIGKTGLVFDHTSGSKDLFMLMRKLDWVELFKMGQKGRKHVLSLGVDNEVAALRYLNLYKKILQSRNN